MAGPLDNIHPLLVGAHEDIPLRGGEDLLDENVGTIKVEYKIGSRLFFESFADLTQDIGQAGGSKDQ